MTIFPVIDTNIIIIGLRTRNTPETDILRAMLNGEILFMASESLMQEYHWALTKDSLLQKNRIPKRTAATVLESLNQNAMVVPTPRMEKFVRNCPDPGDQFIWNLLTQRPDLILVTLDKFLQKDQFMHQRVLTPSAFCAKYSVSQQSRYRESGSFAEQKNQVPSIDQVIRQMQSVQQQRRTSQQQYPSNR